MTIFVNISSMLQYNKVMSLFSTFSFLNAFRYEIILPQLDLQKLLEACDFHSKELKVNES